MGTRQGKVLVTGATGFIGKRLIAALLAEGFQVRAVVRGPGMQFPNEVETITGDLLDRSSLGPVLEGIDAAFYLVHSMAGGRAGFERRDRQAVENFVSMANRAGLRRAIYLGEKKGTGYFSCPHFLGLPLGFIVEDNPRVSTILFCHPGDP